MEGGIGQGKQATRNTVSGQTPTDVDKNDIDKNDIDNNDIFCTHERSDHERHLVLHRHLQVGLQPRVCSKGRSDKCIDVVAQASLSATTALHRRSALNVPMHDQVHAVRCRGTFPRSLQAGFNLAHPLLIALGRALV